MKYGICFIVGAGIGSVVTWKLLEEKYKKLADEEIASVVETFKNREKNNKKNIKEKVEDILSKNEPIEKVEEIIDNNKYTNDNIKKPYVIAPEEFGEDNSYGTKTLTYYADNILTDEIDNPITEDLDIMLGPDALSHFGEYEDDSVYIRDEINEIDYQILKSEKYFSKIPRGRAD